MDDSEPSDEKLNALGINVVRAMVIARTLPSGWQASKVANWIGAQDNLEAARLDRQERNRKRYEKAALIMATVAAISGIIAIFS